MAPTATPHNAAPTTTAPIAAAPTAGVVHYERRNRRQRRSQRLCARLHSVTVFSAGALFAVVVAVVVAAAVAVAALSPGASSPALAAAKDTVAGLGGRQALDSALRRRSGGGRAAYAHVRSALARRAPMDEPKSIAPQIGGNLGYGFGNAASTAVTTYAGLHPSGMAAHAVQSCVAGIACGIGEYIAGKLTKNSGTSARGSAETALSTIAGAISAKTVSNKDSTLAAATFPAVANAAGIALTARHNFFKNYATAPLQAKGSHPSYHDTSVASAKSNAVGAAIWTGADAFTHAVNSRGQSNSNLLRQDSTHSGSASHAASPTTGSSTGVWIRPDSTAGNNWHERISSWSSGGEEYCLARRDGPVKLFRRGCRTNGKKAGTTPSATPKRSFGQVVRSALTSKPKQQQQSQQPKRSLGQIARSLNPFSRSASSKPKSSAPPAKPQQPAKKSFTHMARAALSFARPSTTSTSSGAKKNRFRDASGAVENF
ncbi:hypothetical protein HK405_002365 [Cladochytrium tenue]|nr:hypothetical protein HK405_002365 [Cladochytrium tenue]